jgi:hypothetical protein
MSSQVDTAARRSVVDKRHYRRGTPTAQLANIVNCRRCALSAWSRGAERRDLRRIGARLHMCANAQNGACCVTSDSDMVNRAMRLVHMPLRGAVRPVQRQVEFWWPRYLETPTWPSY